MTYRTTAIPYQQLAAGFLGGKRIFNKDKNYFQSETQNYTSLESVNSTWREVAIFGEDIFTFDNVTASLGARWDRIMFDSFPLPDIPSQIVKPKDADHFSPRLAAAFTIVPGQVIKGSYQEGFHYPDAAFFSSGLFVNAELRSGKVVNYVNDTTIHPTMPDTTIIMNFSTQLPLLKPEILKSIEVNYHGEFFSKLFFDAAVYYNAFKDLLLWKSFRAYEPDLLPSAAVAAFRRMHGFAGAFINAPFDVKILGCEFNAKAIPLDIKAITIETNASINYNKPIDMDRSSNAERAMHELFPSTLVKFGLDCQLFSKRVFVGCNGTYNPAIEMEDKKWFIYDCIKDNDRLVLNGAVGYVFSEKASAKLHCLNILENNIPLPPSGHLGTDVRKIYLQASWNF